mmetsp:Transcript_20062/g.49968  ORF Transcript_20062/g.49968 Transcript_20062/m.49968 type:complete len:269 (+) Transcript_20062:263-1069(+)
MSVAVTPSCQPFHTPAACAADSASNGYNCNTAVRGSRPPGRCGSAAVHLTARCCISPVTDLRARKVSSRCGLNAPATSAARVLASMGNSCSISRSFSSLATGASATAARTDAALGEALPRRVTLRAAALLRAAGLSNLHCPFLARVPEPLGLPRTAVVLTGTDPSTLAAPASAAPPTPPAGSSPKDMSLACFFPSAQTDLSSSFLSPQANRLRSWGFLHSSWNDPPGPSFSFMQCQLCMAVCTSSLSLGSTWTPSGASTLLMRFTSVL